MLPEKWKLCEMPRYLPECEKRKTIFSAERIHEFVPSKAPFGQSRDFANETRDCD